MKFATSFATLLPQPSRAKNPKPQYYGDDPDWPSYLARFDAGKMFLEAARHEFPNLLECKIGSTTIDDFTLENICADLDLDPDAPFCVISNFADEVHSASIPPRDRYRDGGFPIYGSASSFSLVIELADLCGKRGQVPSWVPSVVSRYLRNQRNNVYLTHTLKHQEALEYSQFLYDLFHEAQQRFDLCLIEAILADELAYYESVLVPELGVHLLNYSMMFSAPVVERIVDQALYADYIPTRVPHPLALEIEENLPFWARCRGVVVHVLHDC